LNAHEVRFLIVGGIAFSFYAEPRYTKDLDIWIDPEPENVQRLLRTLDEFGFGSVGLKAEDFLAPGRFVQLGYPPGRIDLLTSIPGVSFAEAWANRVENKLGNARAFYLSKPDLIRNKRAVARPQDLVDVQTLEAYGRPRRRPKPDADDLS
jgi:hypothetical protein